MHDDEASKPLKKAHRPGGKYGQGDISPAAQKSKFETARAGGPTITPATPPSPPDPAAAKP